MSLNFDSIFEINLYNDDGTFKNFVDVLEEIACNWGSYTKIQKKYICKMLS